MRAVIRPLEPGIQNPEQTEGMRVIEQDKFHITYLHTAPQGILPRPVHPGVLTPSYLSPFLEVVPCKF